MSEFSLGDSLVDLKQAVDADPLASSCYGVWSDFRLTLGSLTVKHSSLGFGGPV